MGGEISSRLIDGWFHEIADLLPELAAGKAFSEEPAKAELSASDWAKQQQRLSRLLP
jgi:hypothetical protein